MTKNNKQKKQVSFKPKQKKATPFADAGAIVGSKVSTMFNAPWAKGVGKWLGSGIGQIFGSGDYTMVGPKPEYNVLTNGNQIPKFSTSRQTNIVCHREYIGDISGSSSFNLTSYPLNPGMTKTFPWLSTIAQNYQEYKFHGLIFEFRPLITDFITSGAPGVIIMSTNYNADAPLFNTKQEMENSEFAVSCKPTVDMIHGVECADNQTILAQRYVRSGNVATGQDLRLYDTGTFQFAKQGNPTQLLGELWVSYAVEFFKPILNSDVGGNVASAKVARTTVSSASPFGDIGIAITGDLPVTMAPTAITFDTTAGNYYEVVIRWSGTVAAVAGYPTITPTGCTYQVVAGGATEVRTPAGGVSVTSMSYQVIVLASGTSATLISNATGVFPSGTTGLDIQVTQWSSEAI